MKNKPYTSQEIADIVSTQFENQVAFFNLKDKNAFFFVSPEEARIAIEYIKHWRIDGFKERENNLDAIFKKLQSNYCPEKIDTVIINEESELKDYFSTEFLSKSLRVIEQEDRPVDAIIVNATTYFDIRTFCPTWYDPSTIEEVRRRNVFGRIFTADLYVSSKINDYEIILMSLPYGEKHKEFVIKRTIYVEHGYLKKCAEQKEKNKIS